jgi:hypothetical protein
VNDTTQAPATPAPGPPPKRKRQILGPTGLVVMVGAILLFTAVSIVIEVRANTGTSYRATVDVGARIRDDAFRVVFHVTNTGTRPRRRPGSRSPPRSAACAGCCCTGRISSCAG